MKFELLTRKPEGIQPHRIAAWGRTVMGQWKYPSVGALCCVALAVGSVGLFDKAQFDEELLPLLFLMVIIPIAIRFGNIAGILGTLVSGVIFASFLKPKWSLAIADPAAKHHLIWMLIAGIVLSDLLGAYSLRGDQHRHLVSPFSKKTR